MAPCEMCGIDTSRHIFLQLSSLGRSVDYTIPSFPVFQTKLKHIHFSFLDGIDVYGGFVQDETAGALKEDSILKLCSGYDNAFVIDSNEFDRCVEVEGMKLVDGNIFVIWKWTLLDASEAGNTSDME